MRPQKPYRVQSKAQGQCKGSETNHTECQVLVQRAWG